MLEILFIILVFVFFLCLRVACYTGIAYLTYLTLTLFGLSAVAPWYAFVLIGLLLTLIMPGRVKVTRR